MREGQGRLHGAPRQLYRQLQSYLDTDADVEIVPVELGFSVTFRHDMDRVDASTFDDFLRLEERIEAPSTLFFLQSQFSSFPERIGNLDRQKFELAYPTTKQDVISHFGSIFDTDAIEQPQDSFPSRQGREWLACMQRRHSPNPGESIP